MSENIQFGITEIVNTIDVNSSIVTEVIDINVLESYESVTIDSTQNIIQVNVNKIVTLTPVTSINGLTGDVVLTKGSLGLSNVDNTSDANKPISTLTQTALNSKESIIASGTTSQYWRGDKTWQTLPTYTLESLGAQPLLGYTPYNATNPSGYISGINSSMVTTALGFTPYNASNPNGFISSITGLMVTTALGFTPYNATNPSNFISLTSLSGGSGITYNNTTGVISSSITQYTDSNARASISLTTNGTSGSATYNPTTGVLNIPSYTGGGGGSTTWGSITGTLSSQTDLQSALNAKQGTITLTTTGTSGAATLIGNTLNIPQYSGGGGGSTSPGGSNTQIQFNNSGAFGGSANLTWDGTSITATNQIATGGSASFGAFSPTFTDGIVLDYVSGYGRISVGGGDGMQFFNGGVGGSLLGQVTSGGDWDFNGNLTIGTGTAITGAVNPILAISASATGYVQAYIHNDNAGASSSSDIACYPDNGIDTSGWIDMGITSSAYNDASYTTTGANEGYIFMSAPSGASKTGNLVFATDSTGTQNYFQWYVGGFGQAKSAFKMQLKSTALDLSVQLNSTVATGTAPFVVASTTQVANLFATKAATVSDGSIGIASLSATGTPSSTTYLRGDNTWATIPSGNVGTVTSVSALTIATTGTDITSSVANSTSTPVITLNIPTASATNRGALSSTDWSTFNGKQSTITLTTTGSSGSATFTTNTLNIPTYTLAGLGGQASSTNLTSLSGLTFASTAFVKMTASGTFSLDTNTYYLASNPSGYTNNTGTVTSVAALTIATTGTDITSSVATGTTTAVITLNIPTASATNRGALSSADWSTFNGKQNAITLTTTGSSGSATFVTNTLNIPTYTLAGLGGQASSTNLTSLSGLTFVSTGFVKMTASGTFALDTNTYLTANQSITLSGAVTGTGTTSIATTLASGVVGISNLSATGTPSATTYLRGDNTWATISGGGFTGVLATGTATTAPLEYTLAGSVLKTTPIAGDFEADANGISYYSHADSSRGVMHAEQFISLTGTYTLTSQTAAQKLFNSTTNGAITVKAATTYYFECFYSLSSMSATSGSFGFAIGGNATLTSINWTSQAIKATTLTTAATLQTTYNTTAANTSIATAGTTTSGYAKITGIIRVNAGGTIIPQVSLGVAAAAIVGANSYFRIIPIGTNTVTSVGNWS